MRNCEADIGKTGWIRDPDPNPHPTPDPTPFFSDFKDVKKFHIFSYKLLTGTLSSGLKFLFLVKILF
jgi:hypothetical protein